MVVVLFNMLSDTFPKKREPAKNFFTVTSCWFFNMIIVDTNVVPSIFVFPVKSTTPSTIATVLSP